MQIQLATSTVAITSEVNAGRRVDDDEVVLLAQQRVDVAIISAVDRHGLVRTRRRSQHSQPARMAQHEVVELVARRGCRRTPPDRTASSPGQPERQRDVAELQVEVDQRGAASARWRAPPRGSSPTTVLPTPPFDPSTQISVPASVPRSLPLRLRVTALRIANSTSRRICSGMYGPGCITTKSSAPASKASCTNSWSLPCDSTTTGVTTAHRVPEPDELERRR